jgi:adenylate cyclase
VSTEPTHLDYKLAAILYADVAGYSRLTGEDEEGTHRTLSAYLDAIAGAVEAYHGKVLHYAGDAVLADFDTVSDALICAAVVQQDLERRNRELAENRRVRFRIGVNLGEVIADRGEIYGDGVNVAARLESLAEPGGVCVSGTVRDAVGDKLPLDYTFLGEQKVKNIENPVRAYRVEARRGAALPAPHARSRPRRRTTAILGTAVALLGVAIGAATWWVSTAPSTEETGLPLPDKPSIAVLPFRNLSEDPEQEYFSDGITNDIITDLSKFHDLLVIASNTVLVYKDQAVNIQDVSRELGVRYVLEGSVQRSGAQVRINAQLIDAATGHHLWAERYERDLENLFGLQEEMVQTIVRTLTVKVDEVERNRAMRRETENLEAYDYALRGWELLYRTTRAANLDARKMFQQAIELDPGYSAAYVGLGLTHRAAAAHGWTEFPIQALDRARDLAQKALTFEESSEVYRLLGSVHIARAEYDHAQEASERAMEINPNDWDNHSLRAQVMLYTGRAGEAIQAYETALRINPRMDVDHLYELGLAYYLEGRLADAINTLEDAAALNPDHPFVHVALAAAYALADRPEDAARSVANVHRLHPFFEITSFGTRFRDPDDRERLAEGLRNAGLK